VPTPPQLGASIAAATAPYPFQAFNAVHRRDWRRQCAGRASAGRRPLQLETPRANQSNQPQRSRCEGLGEGKHDGRARAQAAPTWSVHRRGHRPASAPSRSTPTAAAVGVANAPAAHLARVHTAPSWSTHRRGHRPASAPSRSTPSPPQLASPMRPPRLKRVSKPRQLGASSAASTAPYPSQAFNASPPRLAPPLRPPRL